MSFYIGNASTSEPRERFIPNPKIKLLDQVSEVMRWLSALSSQLPASRSPLPHFVSHFVTNFVSRSPS